MPVVSKEYGAMKLWSGLRPSVKHILSAACDDNRGHGSHSLPHTFRAAACLQIRTQRLPLRINHIGGIFQEIERGSCALVEEVLAS